MSLLEDVKRITEKATGWKRPDDPQELLRERKLQAYRFKDDGLIPNHPKWPLVIYKSAVRLPPSLDPAAVFEDLFESNGWGDSWRDGIYDYAHYHSRIHEVLGIARGRGRVQFGGPKGRTLALKAGDVAILPAGTGHQCLKASNDFLVVGAYPPTGTFDVCKKPVFSSLGSRKRIALADRAIARTEWPALSASFTVSRPIPLLAPMIRTVVRKIAGVSRMRHVRESDARPFSASAHLQTGRTNMPRNALVTGGTRGIGAAISKALKAAGYKVAANYGGNDEAAAKFKAETGMPVYKWDVSSFEACAAGIKQVEADLGPVVLER
jgi:uncharacterized protein YjlB